MAERIEFSRSIVVAELPAGGRAFSIEAAADERRAVAQRLGLVALHALRAEGVVSPAGADGAVRLTGRLLAEVEQTCVVTLEPFPATIAAAIESLYSPAACAGADDDVPGCDAPAFDAGAFDGAAFDGAAFDGAAFDAGAFSFCEPLEGDSIDVGEAVTQHLALELDPYPRKPDAVLEWPRNQSDDDAPVAPSPFAALRNRSGGGGSSH